MAKDDDFPNVPKDEKRDAYYRACIREFQELGYEDSMLVELESQNQASTQGETLLSDIPKTNLPGEK